jgi:hypothetical protein
VTVTYSSTAGTGFHALKVTPTAGSFTISAIDPSTGAVATGNGANVRWTLTNSVEL